MTGQKRTIALGLAATLALRFVVTAVGPAGGHFDASAHGDPGQRGHPDRPRMPVPGGGSRCRGESGGEPVVSIGEVLGERAVPVGPGGADAIVLPRRGACCRCKHGHERASACYDCRGCPMGYLGTQGRGPGEFMNLAGVDVWPGDSVVAGTNRTVRARFDSGGTFGRCVCPSNLEPTSRSSNPVRVQRRGAFSVGTERVTGRGQRRSRSPRTRDGDGGRMAGGPMTAGESFEGAIGGGIPFTVARLPFSRGLHTARWSDLVIITPDDEYHIHAYDGTDGSLARIVRRDHANRAPTGAEAEQALERALERTGFDARMLDMVRDGFKDVPVVESFPAFRTLLTDPLDHLWVRETTLPDADRPAPLWTVFDPEGKALGFIESQQV